MKSRRPGRDLLMTLMASAMAVALLVTAENPETRFRLRQNPWTAPRDFRQCKVNLKHVGTALEMYSTDASGRYPRTLEPLLPNYLKAIPTCPSRGRMTFGFSSASNPDAYTMICEGDNHPGIGAKADYPRYHSMMGHTCR